MLRWWLPWLADIYAAESYKGTLLKKTSWFHETGHSLEKWCFITGNPTKWVDYFRPVIWVHPDTGYTHCIYDVHGVWTYVRSSRRLQGYVPIEAPCKAGLAMLKIRLCSAKIGLNENKNTSRNDVETSTPVASFQCFFAVWFSFPNSRPPWEMCATDPADGEAIRSESIQASDLASRKTQAGRTLNVVCSVIRRCLKMFETHQVL